jgi:Transglutaminase-like superfamily
MLLKGATQEYGRTVEAALSLLTVRLTFAFFPFRWALWLLRTIPSGADAPEPSSSVNETAKHIARAVDRTGRYLPVRFACLQRAFAALLMLRRRGISGTVHLGVMRDAGTNSLRAHAWCVVGDVPVTGVEEAFPFASVAAFGG